MTKGYSHFFNLAKAGLLLIVLFCTHGAGAQNNHADTLDIVNWNLEFFGDTPAELPEEMSKTRALMNQMNADIYALVEVVNKDSLASLVQSINGDYGYVISPFGSFASGISDPGWFSAQKLAFVYRKSMVKNVSGRALLQFGGNAYYNWSSGRYPYLVMADVLGSDNSWQRMHFVILHAKAMSDNTSCNRRIAGAQELKDTLDQHFANDRLIILGDFNDDLDESICNSASQSNYYNFVSDSTDANSYHSVTLPLSAAGISSIAGYPSFLDHVILSNEMAAYYVPNSARLLQAEVNNWVLYYNQYVSDHFPVKTQYVVTGTSGITNREQPVFSIYPVPAGDRLSVSSGQQGDVYYRVLATDGRQLASGTIANGNAAISLSSLTPGTYIIRLSAKGSGHWVSQLLTKQ